MAHALAPEAFHEVALDQPPITIKAVHTPGDIHLLEVYETRPEDLDSYNVRGVLHDDARSQGIDPFETPFRVYTGTIWPDCVLEQYSNETPFKSLLKGLGYGITIESERAEGQLVTKKTGTYPSIERSNRLLALMEQAGTDRTLEFVKYEGGEYEVGEFLEAFVNRGQVLMASEQPYAAHDLGDHLLGWIGLDSTLVNTLRDRAGAYMERAQAERELPEVPCSSDRLYDREQQDVLWPSQVVLRRVVIGLDEITADLTRTAIFDRSPAGNSEVARSLAARVNELVNLSYGSRYTHEPHLPDGLLGRLDNFASGVNILKRYQLAEQVCREAGEVI